MTSEEIEELNNLSEIYISESKDIARARISFLRGKKQEHDKVQDLIKYITQVREKIIEVQLVVVDIGFCDEMLKKLSS